MEKGIRKYSSIKHEKIPIKLFCFEPLINDRYIK